ncbi:MAG: hypothetical protein R3E89_12425 [Thiolinea sp.]
MNKFNVRALLLGLLLIIGSGQLSAAVWDDENEWDANWERRYQHWVKTQWTDDIFMNPAKPIYYKFENDCADASYAMRLIFSFENKLPFVVNNQMRPSQTISNRMKTWDNLPTGQRVRKFLDYIADMTSTKSLRYDTYPVALNDIKAGDIYVARGCTPIRLLK